MISITAEHEELRLSIERLRALLENLVVRGLRACGPDELGQLKSYTEHLESSGAGHVAANLADLHAKIEVGDRSAAKALLTAQVSVRLLERLLTLRVVSEQYAIALAVAEGDEEEEEDEDEDEDEDEA